MLAILPAGHRLAARPLAWADLAGETFIAFTPDSGIGRLTDLAFTLADATPAAIVETRAVATAAGMIATYGPVWPVAFVLVLAAAFAVLPITRVR
jgi:DNA-binding transcriptional LysR family regulator